MQQKEAICTRKNAEKHLQSGKIRATMTKEPPWAVTKIEKELV